VTESLIGRVPDHWEILTLGQATSRSRGNIQTGPFGSQLHAADYVDVGIPSIMPKNIGDNRVDTNEIARITESDAKRLARYRVRAGDIVYSRRGDVEKRALITEIEDGWLCGTGCLRVRFGDDSISPKFASYYLSHPSVRSWIVRHAHGATMPNLNTSILSALPFVLPPLPEQHRIAHFLGTLDDKIDLNRQMNRTLDEIARTLFRSWFVDFDPVRTKADGRQPEGMDAETAALFSDRFVDSDLGPIPEGWEVRSIDDVADVNRSSLKTSDQWESLRYVDISSTKEGNISEVIEYERGQEPSRAKRRLHHGDTVLSTVRPDRRSYFLALNPPSDLIASTGFAVLSPDTVPWSYLHSALTRNEVFETLGNLADGGAYPAIRPGVIGSLPVAVPDNPVVLDSYHRFAGPFYELAAQNRQEALTLAELRDTLCPMLLLGRVE
jgi:type I restriction enzyme S subunit